MSMTRGSTRASLGALGGCAVALVFVASGCIEARRQVGDTTGSDTSDTVEGDSAQPDTEAETTDPDGDGTVSNDLVEVDTSVVEPDAVIEPDGTEQECQQDEDCEYLVHDGCVSYECIGFRCVASPKDDVPCSDGNACTEGELCDDGVCKGGNEVDCDDFDTQCLQVANQICDPTDGCGVTARARGVVCDDGNGPDAGACEKGWRIPEDTCDGLGQCVDRSTLVPNDTIHPLAGAWHLVLSTAPTTGNGITVRAVVTFDNEGSFVFSNVVRSATGLDGVSEGNGGTFCTSVTGETVIDFSGSSLVARADKAGEVMVLANQDLNRNDRVHGVAIRGGGALNSVSGTYRLVSTALHQGTSGQLMTWQGEVGFDNGCINQAGAISTGGGLGAPYSFDPAVSACFFPAAGGQRLLARLVPPDVATPGDGVPIQWTGAIGGRGDILLMTRDDGSLRYGIIILVKDRAADRANLWGEFGFVSLTGGLASSTQPIANAQPRLERGVLSYQAGADLDVTLSTGGNVGTGWWWTAAAGSRYAHRAVFGARVLEHTGWVARSDAFLMGWRVAPPTTLALPQPLELTPLEGSLFLGVKSADYRPSQAGTQE